MSDDCPLCPNYKDTPPHTINWISCEKCQEWYHNHCLNLTTKETSRIIKYYCPNCVKLYSLTTEYKRTSSRSKVKIDYVALNDGDVESSYLIPKHHHISHFQKWENKVDINDQIDLINGDELTLGYALRTKLIKPVKILANKRDGLGLSVPNFTIDDLVESLGEDHPIEVMDVLTQNGTKEKFTLSKWRDYFMNPLERDRILNVLSLEISQCSIGESIKRPQYVEDADLVDRVWSNDVTNKPQVSKYCLMGVENSYTDFHLDFAGSSVYYTVLKGQKEFLFYPPTELNLKKYCTWIVDPLVNTMFLGNLGLENGVKVTLNTNDVMIIPSGWIHAVFTPVDTVVIGGNFLTSFNIVEQLTIIDIEIKTKVDKRYKFPNFNKLMWLTANDVLNNKNLKIGEEIDLFNCKELLNYLKRLDGLKHEDKFIKDSIPIKIVGKPAQFLQRFEEYLKIYENNNEEVNNDFKRSYENANDIDNHDNDYNDNQKKTQPQKKNTETVKKQRIRKAFVLHDNQ